MGSRPSGPRRADLTAPVRYLLNAPVLSTYGDYRFEGPFTLAQARHFAAQNVQSAIGHEGTATFLAQCLHIEVPCQREAIHMQPGDQALVFRLHGRLPEGSVLDAAALALLPHEFGLLTRLR